MAYKSETDKIRPIIQGHLHGSVLDIGCGDDKVHPKAFGVDVRDLPGVDLKVHFDRNLHSMIKRRFDVIFSSHCLEHLAHPYDELWSWRQLLSTGGKLILYLPEARLYDNRENPEHFQSFEYVVFMRWFKLVFPAAIILDSALDEGEDKYSFYLVAQF